MKIDEACINHNAIRLIDELATSVCDLIEGGAETMKCRNCKHNGFRVDEDGTQFSWCDARNDNLDIDAERECAAFAQASNAERVRAMTDTELAEFMNHGACPPGEDVSERCCDEDGGSVPDMCNLCWLNWLQQEATA